VGEYLHMIAASVLIVLLFLGGWHFWGISGSDEVVGIAAAALRVGILAAKVLVVVVFFMISRWSWPRFRFDQLMALAWKVMLPLGLVNLLAVAAWVEYGAAMGWSGGLPMALWGWSVLVGAWLVVTLAAPAACDNRPRIEPAATTPNSEE